jgi:dephospho-CoA kinase
MPLKIGITGGIGSGKSYICSILNKMGYLTYNSDIEAKKIIETNKTIKKKLIELFGNEIYVKSILNKSLMSKIIFNDDVARQKVNSIIHPFVKADFNKWLKKQTDNFVFYETAILFETGSYKDMNFNILISSDENLRIQRTIKRDASSRESVLKIISKQWSDETKILLSDFVIINDETLPLLKQLENVEKKLLNLNSSNKN